MHNRLRAQSTVAVGGSSVQLIGPNTGRVALVISCPQQPTNPELPSTQIAGAVDTTGAGTALTYTVPAGVTGLLTSATYFGTGAALATVALQLVRGATTITLERGNLSAQLNNPVPLTAGDIVRWQITTGGTTSTGDFTLGVQIDQGNQRVTLSTTSPAVLDSGINLYPGQQPLVLLGEHIGQALTEPMFAIAASGTVSITVWDIFD